MKSKSLVACWGIIALAGLGTVHVSMAGTRYNELEDAAVAEAKLYQAGGRAHPIMTPDGKVLFAYGQSMPKLTCSPTRACDLELQPGEKGKNVILGDSVNWVWQKAESVENGVVIQHGVFQPKDVNLETNVIITTDRRTYHMKLYSPKVEGNYLNRVGFYYPQEIVNSWGDSQADEASKKKEDDANVTQVAVSPDKLDFNYEIKGETSFKPVRVFNNGEMVYLEMPESMKIGSNPILLILDANGKAMVTNYRRDAHYDGSKVFYIVDKLFVEAELLDGDQKVRISWKNKKGASGWFSG